jgi:hypothetical protein
VTASLPIYHAPAASARVSVPGARLRIRALIAMGHSTGRIARALGDGSSSRAVQRIARGNTTHIPPSVRARIGCLYEAWWDLVPPERMPAERNAAAAARRWARQCRWCTGMGLDDDQLDDIGYEPQCTWRPATGTGIASDNPLRVWR